MGVNSRSSNQEVRLGVHTSVAGGAHLALERAAALGCNTMQIFSHNPRQWAVSDIAVDIASEFKSKRMELGINPVYVHTSYLINLAASDPLILKKSIALLKRELDLADELGADYVVVHTGSDSQGEAAESRLRAVNALKGISGQWKSHLLLENTAGERGDITSQIGDLAEIIKLAELSLIAGITFDTCHAFAAGYDLRSDKDISSLATEIEKLIGLDKVKLIHLNDAKKVLGSHVDRHWHIGEGEIGLEGIGKFINHKAFRGIPLVLETPKKDEEDDPRNLAVVRKMLADG
jgi:deoxyribonuclease IV